MKAIPPETARRIEEEAARQRAVRRRAIYQATIEENPFIPEDVKARITPKQAEFLTDESREILYGGAAGGGKSYALLLAAAQFVTEPGYSALVLRRTFMQLEKSDSILAIAKEWWLPRKDVHFNGDTHTFTFPSGATIEFGHMDNKNSIYNYQGGAYRCVCYDELTQFEQMQYTYLFSRQRKKAGLSIPLRMRSSANPGGIGHDWVKKRFIDPKTRKPRSKFISAKLEDNPNVDQESYIESLSYLDPITRAQLQNGDWDAIPGGRFKKEWFKWYRLDPDDPSFIITPYDERFQPHMQPKFQTCDPSASKSEEADDFVISTWVVTPKGNLLWIDCFYGKFETPEQVENAQRLYRRWKPMFFAVEEVLNQRSLAQLLRRSTDPPMIIESVSPLGKDKFVRSAGASVLVKNGKLLLPEDNPAFPLDYVTGQLIRFTGDDGQPDDIADTLFYAAELFPFVSMRRGVAGSAPGHYGAGNPYDRATNGFPIYQSPASPGLQPAQVAMPGRGVLRPGQRNPLSRY